MHACIRACCTEGLSREAPAESLLCWQRTPFFPTLALEGQEAGHANM